MTLEDVRKLCALGTNSQVIQNGITVCVTELRWLGLGFLGLLLCLEIFVALA